MSDKRNRIERLGVVLEIAKILKKFPTSAINDYFGKEDYINYYDSKYPAIEKIKKEFDYYINQDDSNPKMLTGVSGKISFPEIEKYIEYVLPIRRTQKSHFVFRTTEKDENVPYTIVDEMSLLEKNVSKSKMN
jgi:hypothetical protein